EGDAETGYTSEGYADNFYLQLVRNVRRYKGIKDSSLDMPVQPSTAEAPSGREYLSLAIANEPRNSGGYKQAASDNFVRKINVSHTLDEIVFRIECENGITAPVESATNWMNIYFGFEKSAEAKWETYSYVLNRRPGNGVTSLDKYDGNAFLPLGECALEVADNVMTVRVPISLLPDVTDAYGFVMDFKVADSIEVQDDIMDYYVSGSSVPIGRLSYTYAAKIKDEPVKKKGCGAVAGAGASSVLLAAGALGAVAVRAVEAEASRSGKGTASKEKRRKTR
ncbi:MAG: hypothetical protein II739_00390, partial [Clostridia bacterium]|nr:hypothetical protein [Clostridia bacterium]